MTDFGNIEGQHDQECAVCLPDVIEIHQVFFKLLHLNLAHLARLTEL